MTIRGAVSVLTLSALAMLGVSTPVLVACDRTSSSQGESAPSAAPSTAPPPPFQPERVDLHERAMGTSINIVSHTTPRLDRAAIAAAGKRAFQEIRRLEALMTTYNDSSEIAHINRDVGKWVPVSAETFEVIDKGLWAGRVSDGTFDITYHTLGDLWKFGTAADQNPKPPPDDEVKRRKSLLGYELVHLDREKRRVRIPPLRAIGLGGIAKGYAVDKAANVLRSAGLTSFLVQAGGDLYGAGRKPDGSPWVSGIQDPRGPRESYFATIPLTDRAFSTAGDYARAFIYEGRRYHHIIDPRTGYPATASRSVTVWAPTAFLADAIDDAVFILGPKKGLALVESLDGVGAVIVDADNRVHVSKLLDGKITILKQPTDGV